MNRFFMSRRGLLKRGMSTAGTPAPPPPPTPTPDTSPIKMSARYRPSDFEKIILVWTKKYKSRAEIPSFVSAELIEKTRSQARIKISNILIFLTALGSFGAILAGKSAAKRGDSVHQMNLDWHKQYQDEQKAKQEALSNAK